jgi:5-methyltetrahydrofolate--homocysteine methyltransferase
MPSDLRDVWMKRVIVADGGMGTQLMAAGMQTGAAPELWNVDNAPAVADVHRRYRAAGCDFVTTNTFGGSRFTLSRHGLDARMAELNRAGAALARQAVGPEAWVLGDIGPFGDFLEPVGDFKADDVRQMFLDQALALRHGGADGIIVETMADPAEMMLAIEAARQVADWPVLATFAFNRAGDAFATMMGATVPQCVDAAVQAGADAVGANCGTSLTVADYLDLGRQLVAAARGTPVIVQPNAGQPQLTAGSVQYAVTPADVAQLAHQLVAAGVKIVGGCCGTTPEHLAAVAKRVK